MTKYILSTMMCMMAAVSTVGAQIAFSGSDKAVIEEKPEASTGLDKVYVLYSTQGVKMSYSAAASSVKWQRFSNMGGAYAEDMQPVADGGTYTVTLGPDDMGYIIEDGTSRHYFWVVNYQNHQAHLNGLTPADDQDCDRTRLRLDGEARPITYYTINGAPKQLSRELKVEYSTLKYDETSEAYAQVSTHQVLASVDGSFSVPAPLCDTRFTISGDRFLRQWGMEESAGSATFATNAVEARSKAEQTLRENDNEQTVEGGTLGGSAPVEIRFSAAVTDAAIFREWQMSKDPEFEVIDDRFPQLDLEYTFRENGTTYVRFVANNAAGTCEYIADTYDIFVGESALLCPNAFSPNDDGVNDEWKVSYKSIVSFECHIFNRWGQEMTSFTDPGQGWDGKHGGKTVPTGVYYYVIRAKGSDGREYKLSGDINILNKKTNTQTQTPEE